MEAQLQPITAAEPSSPKNNALQRTEEKVYFLSGCGEIYRATKLRLAIYAFFFLNIIMVASTAIVFSTTALPLHKALDVSLNDINMLSNVYNFTYIPMTLLAMYLYSKTTPDWPIRVACVIFLVGAWTRSFFVYGDTYWPLMLG